MSRNSKPTKLTRSLDPTKHAKVFLALNEKHVTIINTLLATGLWGSTANQVALRLFDSACAVHLPPAPSPEELRALAKAKEYADANGIDPSRVFAVPHKNGGEWVYAIAEKRESADIGTSKGEQ